MPQILIATGNEGKKKEMLSFFGSIEGIEFLGLSDFPEVEDVEENGKTFEENALIKAEYYAEKFSIPTLGEDSGFILSAFPKKFGLKTKREFKSKDDMDWLTQFMHMMDGVENRKAIFYSAMALVDPSSNKKVSVIGQSYGEIAEFPQAPIEKGIPVSSVFIPEGGLNEVFASMTRTQKNEVSHRGSSSGKMVKIFETFFA